MRPLQALTVWFVTSVVFVASGGMHRFSPPYPQVLLLGAATLLFGCYARRPVFRNWVDSLPARAILGFHLVRFVGVYFLVLHARGELPWDFAVLGGWGDIAVASWALVLLLVHRGDPPERGLMFQAWNVIGLIDIVSVIAMAGKNAMAAPESMAPLLRLPLGLLPTFVVPLILFTHGIVLRRALTRA